MEGNCLQSNVVYQAIVEQPTQGKEDGYIGLTGNSFKTRYSNHLNSFNNEVYKNETCLSIFVWDLKEKKEDHNIKWKIIDRGRTYSPINNRCNLCLTEKFYLILSKDLCTINNRYEFGNTCRQKEETTYIE